MKRIFACSLLILTAMVALGPQARARLPEGLPNLKYVDLRDLHTYKTDLSGTANHLMTALETRAGEFVDNPSLTFFRSGPVGPAGSTPEGSDTFQISSFEQKTHKNTILSAEFENVFEEKENEIYRVRLLLFVHDSAYTEGPLSKGYYFRRLTVRIDWTQKDASGEPLIEVLGKEGDIPLENTNFKINIDLLARKAILNDANNGITKVFPIAVGSFDVRTEQSMDGTVRLLTQEFPGGSMRLATGPSDSANTRSRTNPSYYRGRPFLALLDNTGTYRQVGMHYQIDGWGLTRGFVSHGCMRVRDMDLYQLDIILNETPRTDAAGKSTSMSAEVRNYLTEWAAVDHPMPKEDTWSNIVTYSDAPSPKEVQCPRKNPYSVRWYGSYMHTVADGDCLTMVVRRNQPTTDVVSYLGERHEGDMFYLPNTYIGGQEHVPVALKAGQTVSGWESDGGEENRRRSEQNIIGAVLSIPGQILGNGLKVLTGSQKPQQPKPSAKKVAIAAQWNIVATNSQLMKQNCAPGRELQSKQVCDMYANNIRVAQNVIFRLKSGQK